MAPERLRAFSAPEPPPLPRPRDRQRADIYALGLILAEALTGHGPDVSALSPSLPARTGRQTGHGSHRWRSVCVANLRRVPPDLRPILLRCLAPDPADRYGRAAELADDLDRVRTNRELRFAAPSSHRARVARWSRRHRPGIAAGLLLLAGAVPVGFAGVRANQNASRDEAMTRLEVLWGGSTPGVYRCRRDGQRVPDSQVDPARAALSSLDAYGLLKPGDWRQRDDVAHLNEPDRLDLEAWLMEQAWRYADAVAVRPGWPEAWRRALVILERVGGPAPPIPIRTQMARLGKLLGQPAPRFPRVAAPQWLEHYLQGVENEPSRPTDAMTHYRASLTARRDAYWSHYRLAAAACTPEIRDFATADVQLRRCLALRPRNPLLHLFRRWVAVSSRPAGRSIRRVQPRSGTRPRTARGLPHPLLGPDGTGQGRGARRCAHAGRRSIRRR